MLSPPNIISFPTKIILTSLFIILLLLIVYERLHLLKEKKRIEDIDKIEASLNYLISERGLLLKNVAREIADILTDQIDDLDNFIKIIGIDKLKVVGHRRVLINRILKRICDIFEMDRAGSGEERLTPR